MGEDIFSLFFIALVISLVISIASECPGLMKGLGLAIVIIGVLSTVLFSLTVVGSLIGIPMIFCGSILLCCCDGRREVDPGHRLK